MFMIGRGNNSIYEYTLTTGFDISTASYVQSFSVSAQNTAVLGITLKPDGSKIYYTGKLESTFIGKLQD